MKISHCFFVALSLFNLNIAKAQNEITESEIALRSHLEFEALKDGVSFGNGTGTFFILDLSEDKSDNGYSVILIEKSIIKNATEIKLYFKKTEGIAPYTMTIPNNNTYVIESDKDSNFAAIPLGQLRTEYNAQKNLVEPLFYPEDFLAKIYPGSEEKDLSEIKRIMRIPIPKKTEQTRYKLKNPPR
ncbi:hypothetical protein [Flavobacterium sp. 102]|uniref:hypothetical protein n=1 Tax=Flavobacterium sp. 102 TaxID=2135623 RepID=UPI000EB42AFF|nr:hypothetical protein [Flavobacterium sp. 102]RKS01540.1 hypothetical protein C8C84_1203 [Flavobacterium sp. 102]